MSKASEIVNKHFDIFGVLNGEMQHVVNIVKNKVIVDLEELDAQKLESKDFDTQNQPQTIIKQEI